MNYLDKQELITLVIDEADKLKQHATAEELARLDLPIRSNDPYRCIYGLLARGCTTDRAIELLRLCAIPYSSNLQDFVEPTETFEPKSRTERIGRIDVFSAIEFYIFRRFSKKAPLVKYLKGEHETLTPKDLDF